MRITQQSMQRHLQAGIRARQAAVARAQSEAISGRRISQMSDDPVGGAQVLRLQQIATDLGQFQRNGDLVGTRLAAEGVAFKSLRAALDVARDVATSTTSNDPADPARQAGLAKVQALRAQVLGLANTRIGGEYLFSGSRTDQPAFASDGTYQGDAYVREVEIDDGVRIPVGHPGEPVFGDALRALDALIQQLQTGTQNDVQAQVPVVGAAIGQALVAETEAGERGKTVTQAHQDLAASAARFLTQRDQLRDADPAEAILVLQNEQTALERAYAVVGRVLQASLADYLR